MKSIISTAFPVYWVHLSSEETASQRTVIQESLLEETSAATDYTSRVLFLILHHCSITKKCSPLTRTWSSKKHTIKSNRGELSTQTIHVFFCKNKQDPEEQDAWAAAPISDLLYPQPAVLLAYFSLLIPKIPKTVKQLSIWYNSCLFKEFVDLVLKKPVPSL